MIFKINPFDYNLFIKFINKKKPTILDYGCGTGIWKHGGGGD